MESIKKDEIKFTLNIFKPFKKYDIKCLILCALKIKGWVNGFLTGKKGQRN